MKTGLVVGLIILALVIVGAVFYLSQPSANQYQNNSFNNPDVGNDNSVVEVNNPPQTGQNNSSMTQAKTQLQILSVEIKSFAFMPGNLEIKAGDTVVWTNKDSSKHTVTSDSGSELNSPTMSSGEKFSHTFTKAGTYAYHCAFHSGMTATITVK